MEEIGVSKLTPSVLNRLAKGLPVKLKQGVIKMMVDKTSSNKMKKSFMKGKGILKKLNMKEIEENLKMKGEGIFGDRFDKFLTRLGNKTGFNLKKHAYQLGDALKPAVKAGIATALTAGATAATPFLAETAPGLIPALPAAVVATSAIANKFLDKPKDFGVGSGIYAQGEGLYAGSGIYASGRGFYDSLGQFHPNKRLTSRHNFNKVKQMKNSDTTGSGLYASTRMKGRGKKILDQKFSVNEAIDFFKEDLPNAIQGKGRKIPSNFGGGQLQRNVPQNELASVGLGGTLLSRREQHPAMNSKPYSQHFVWGSTLPKKYQQFNNGLQ